MNGTIAALFFVTGLADMSVNHCETGCLAREAAPTELSFSLRRVQFQNAWIGSEIYASYASDVTYGPFQPQAAASITDDNAVWVGVGAQHRHRITDALSFDFSFMPGFYDKGNGPDLGGNLQFRASIGMSLEVGPGALRIDVDHRSNGDTQTINPGLETLGISYIARF